MKIKYLKREQRDLWWSYKI